MGVWIVVFAVAIGLSLVVQTVGLWLLFNINSTVKQQASETAERNMMKEELAAREALRIENIGEVRAGRDNSLGGTTNV